MGRIARFTLRIVAVTAGVVAIDFLVAQGLLWHSYDISRRTVASGSIPAGNEQLALAIECRKGDSKKWKRSFALDLDLAGATPRASMEVAGKSIWLKGGERTMLAAAPKVRFECGPSDLAATRAAIREAASTLPALDWWHRAAVSLRLFPLLTGYDRHGSDPQWHITALAGRATLGPGGTLRQARGELPIGDSRWRLALDTGADAPHPATNPPDAPSVSVAARELDASVAAAIAIVSLQWRPVTPEQDTVRHEGRGTLVIQNGQRRLLLRGSPYEIGYQHGKLLATNIRRLTNRVVYGVGLYYSIEKGEWFADEARKLVERQRPFIDPSFFEEMRGLAKGSGLPEDLIAAANIFPEFFHCSGVAIRGKATAGGQLLHARVLDYMTHAGLQDEAVVLAVAKDGALRFVNVSYAGFIGSVTGMNEAKVAIGEMGGRGEGLWDGTPMSLLLRGALENCNSTEAVLQYMRGHQRTCEYYYVVSDGKDRSCAGIKATPDIFEIVPPGSSHPQLPDPVEDAVLLSADARYKELVRRVRAAYGKIDEERLIQILDRPVSMGSNLHNVIFAPERLTLRVANASRNGPACRETYHAYDWDDLFGAPGGRL
ncbi:MAG TPA: C45 family autoproteolytic acyltransferase/hydrolase [Verrucomicrobiae bacterium]|nr:C45 family autoproteolytic acyltransferase/hydrolase [Verrucomicrobiae bacterium]